MPRACDRLDTAEPARPSAPGKRPGRPLVALTRGVPDAPRRAAHERHGLVAAALKPGQHHEAEQVAEVERLGGGVESAVHAERAGRGSRREGVRAACHVSQQAARAQHAEQAGPARCGSVCVWWGGGGGAAAVLLSQILGAGSDGPHARERSVAPTAPVLVNRNLGSRTMCVAEHVTSTAIDHTGSPPPPTLPGWVWSDCQRDSPSP